MPGAPHAVWLWFCLGLTASRLGAKFEERWPRFTNATINGWNSTDNHQHAQRLLCCVRGAQPAVTRPADGRRRIRCVLCPSCLRQACSVEPPRISSCNATLPRRSRPALLSCLLEYESCHRLKRRETLTRFNVGDKQCCCCVVPFCLQ